jgi:hypothetical protein
MKRTVHVKVQKSRFGKCVLTFRGPGFDGDTNVYVTCDKDPDTTIRVWYYTPTRRWACEIQRPNGYNSYGTQMLDGTYGWSTNKAAWEFAAKLTWH